MVNDFINELRDNNLIEEHDVPVKSNKKELETTTHQNMLLWN